MIYDVNYYHNMINDFSSRDLESCGYDYYQHNINLRCYLSELYNKINAEFNITIDDISVLDFVNSKLNDVKKNLNNYKNNVLIN